MAGFFIVVDEPAAAAKAEFAAPNGDHPRTRLNCGCLRRRKAGTGLRPLLAVVREHLEQVGESLLVLILVFEDEVENVVFIKP
jgi:hypothetical protein